MHSHSDACCPVLPRPHTRATPSRPLQVDKELGGWAKAQAKFFDAGAILDDIQTAVGRKRAEQRAQAAAEARAGAR